MRISTVLIMFAVIAAFGLITATLVAPIAPQAQAQIRKLPPQAGCHNTEEGQAIGECASAGRH